MLCDINSFLDLAKEYDLKVIEDCAQSHGATYKGRPVGSLGDGFERRGNYMLSRSLSKRERINYGTGKCTQRRGATGRHPAGNS
ncbi:MAG: DegT/DnrJ/EryC1/StrS family aminotransferase [Deltaproteobacteria bacterium]|nr:DegT/DnrJ/EryC1/StrS family aminotransferase [Deltaproteobacteria bacterium]